MKQIILIILLFSASVSLADIDIDADDNGAVDVARGGTNLTTLSANIQSALAAANYAAVRALMDLETGTDFYSITAADLAFQPLDADLTTWAGITPSANVQTLLGAADYAAFRASLDLEAGTDFYSKDAMDTLLGGYQLEPAEGAFVDGDKTKLDGIATGATVEAFTESAFTTKVGADHDTNAELAALFVLADQRSTEGETMLSTGDGDATPDISNAGTGIASRLWQSANTGSTTITDFDDGDDHSEFAEGDWFTLRVDDANTILDFNPAGNMRRVGNADLSFTGDGSVYDIVFRHTSTFWLAYLPVGLSGPNTYAESTFGDATVVLDADGLTMTAAQMRNTKFIASGAGTWNMLAVFATANFVIISTTADNVDLNPDDSDAITYCDGDSCATGAAGAALRLTDIGDTAACTYGGAANSIHCNVSDGVVVP